MNSWNRLDSIANNVKIYKLGLTYGQQNKAYEFLDCEKDGKDFRTAQENCKYIIENAEIKTEEYVTTHQRKVIA